MPGSQVGFEGRKAEAEVDGVEEKNEAEPYGAKKEGAKRPRQNDRNDYKDGARNHERVLRRARENDRRNGSIPPAKRLDEVSSEKNSRPDRGIRPAVTQPTHWD